MPKLYNSTRNLNTCRFEGRTEIVTASFVRPSEQPPFLGIGSCLLRGSRCCRTHLLNPSEISVYYTSHYSLSQNCCIAPPPSFCHSPTRAPGPGTCNLLEYTVFMKSKACIIGSKFFASYDATPFANTSVAPSSSKARGKEVQCTFSMMNNFFQTICIKFAILHGVLHVPSIKPLADLR